MEDEKKILPFEIIPGLRKTSSLIYTESEKQLYKQKNKYNNSTRYVCYQKDCRASIKIDENNICTRFSGTQEHLHGNQEELYKKMKLINSIKTECASKGSFKRSVTREIFENECEKNQDCAYLVQYKKMKRNLCKIRNESLPKNPANPIDLKTLFTREEIMATYGTSRLNEGETFYRDTIIEENFSYTIFLSPSICQLINSTLSGSGRLTREYIIDSSLTVFPPCGYKHLLIVYIAYHDSIYPMMYLLLSNKTKAIYEHSFQFINTNLFEFKANAFYVNYDSEIPHALKKSFPSVKVKSCWFQYCQELRRNAKKIINFPPALMSNNDYGRIFKKVMMLPLLKADDIRKAFHVIIKEEISKLSSQNNFDLLNNFLKYFEKQWMMKVTPSVFSVYGESIIRTKDFTETQHSQLNLKLSKFDNFFKFLEFILNEDCNKTVDFKDSLEETAVAASTSSASNAVASYRRHKKNVDLIIATVKKLDSVEITLNDFLDRIIKYQSKIFIDNINWKRIAEELNRNDQDETGTGAISDDCLDLTNDSD